MDGVSSSLHPRPGGDGVQELRRVHADARPGQLGRRLADREPQVKIFGETYDVRAEVATIGGLSAHAGQDLLIKYAAGVKGTVKKVFLVHGEEMPVGILTQKLQEQNIKNIFYPDLHDYVDI